MKSAGWLALLLFVGCFARGDLVTLRSCEKIEGKITLETPSRLVINQAGKSRAIDRATVEKVEKSEPTRTETKTEEPVPASAAQPVAAPGFEFWPPKRGEKFPDLHLLDRSGKIVRLSSLKGKIIVLEPVGMTCPACQAFSGGNRVGGLEGVQPQSDCPALDEYISPAYTGVSLSDPRILWVQLILYNMQMKAPTTDDLKRWSEHFPDVRRPNCYVLAGTPEMIGPASYAMIPGIQLIDRNFVLRSDFRGHGGGDDLGKHLLPLVRQLIQGQGK